MSATAIALRPQLLMPARELCGDRADLDAEDLVGRALLVMCEKTRDPQTPAELHHWLRTVMRNQNAKTSRDLRGVQFESWERFK